MGRAEDYDYELPTELIAQEPASRRTDSRLLAYDRASKAIRDLRFCDIESEFEPGDLLVLNDTRVLPARLKATKLEGGGALEILAIRPLGEGVWRVMLKPGKRVRAGTRAALIAPPTADPAAPILEVVQKRDDGMCDVRCVSGDDFCELLHQFGEIPLPPYIERDELSASDRERYQTVFARTEGSVAAPTAGLHFDENLLERLEAKGVRIARLTLHVGPGTFTPVRVSELENHQMHSEWMHIDAPTADLISAAKRDKRRVIAVGTTSMRALESAASPDALGSILPGARDTDLFIYPPYPFRIVDAMITNFHLPKSTLLMLVSAFLAPNQTTGASQLLEAYRHAVRERYRFYSFGDAMWIHGDPPRA